MDEEGTHKQTDKQELTKPAEIIFNKIVKTCTWPNRWKEEQGIPLNKVKPDQPESESDLKVISLIPFLSKTLEKIVMDWLLHFVGSKMDWSQFGGTKGSSINHYLIDMIIFIHYNQDIKEPKAVPVEDSCQIYSDLFSLKLASI